MTELREYIDKKSRQNIRQGDIVSVHEDNTQRQMWRLGTIMEQLPGRDGNFRSARVRVMSGGQEITRPLQRLYPLEVTLEKDHSYDESATTTPIRVVSDTDIPVVVVASH